MHVMDKGIDNFFLFGLAGWVLVLGFFAIILR